MTTQLAKIDSRGLEIQNTNDLTVAVQMIVGSELCPLQYKGKPKDAMIAILAGRQVGFGPIQALQYIAVINGRPSMYGDGPSGLAQGSGKVEWIREWWELDGKEIQEPNHADLRSYPDGLTACWQTKRKDNSEPSKVSRFSVADAKVAGLWGKKGPWTSYTKRMLTCRARAWGLRDNYSDALQGITQAEEWADMQPKREKDPLEARVEVIEGELQTESQEPTPEPGDALDPKDERKYALLTEIQTAMLNGGGDPKNAATFIQAVCMSRYGHKSPATVAELNGLREELKKYDIATGDKLPE